MKFISLLKKELREMLNSQTIIMLIFVICIMFGMGGLMNKSVEEANEESGKITICDLDDTEFSRSVLDFLKNPTSGMENEVNIISLESDDYAAELDRLDTKSFVVIPKGFTDCISDSKQANVVYVSRMTSMAMMANVNAGSQIAVQLIEAAVKSAMYADFTMREKLTDEEISLLESPVSVEEHTIIGDKSEQVSQLMLFSTHYSNSLFMPLVVYILILMGSQTMINAVSAEKIDKTLETLLSAPISRLNVISAKMIAAAAVALLNAVVYMIGMNKMSFSPAGEIDDKYIEAAKQLGLTFDLRAYILIGIQMLLTMLIALSVAMILGAFAKNIKSSQTLVMPLMFVTIAPFMAAMFVDISSLPGAVKYLLYAIPFTHTFMASDTVLFNKMDLYAGGLVYQIIFLAVCMFIAVKVFTSDVIFTAGGNSGSSKKFRRGKNQRED